jgi:hypothetical protein
MSLEVKFVAKVWLYEGAAAWHFASLPIGLSAQLKKLFGGQARGWNSLPVEARVGASVWRSSVFYDTKRKAYLLPLKAAIRKQEGLKAGRKVVAALRILL